MKFPFSRFIVRDRSMEPAFGEFDRVFTYNWARDIQKGSVVVFKHGGERLIKRVRELESDSLVVGSDNKKLAKAEYKVKKRDIIGRVFLKY